MPAPTQAPVCSFLCRKPTLLSPPRRPGTLHLQYPQLEELQGNFVFSLNQEYLGVDEEQQLKSGDEVAVIPPISGG